MKPVLLAIDQGSSATKCIAVDLDNTIIARASAPVPEQYPEHGWVEQSPEDIWVSVQTSVAECMSQLTQASVVAVGISTQRESAVIWDRHTRQAVTPLLSWQDQRTTALKNDLLAAAEDAQDLEARIRHLSGLPLDPMFSALKIAWLLDNMDDGRQKARQGTLCAGTVDAYLLSQLGADATIEIGNASRTQLLNVTNGRWDDDLLSLFDIPAVLMPAIVPSRHDFATADNIHPSLAGVPVAAVMADSHSALFAHGAHEPGIIKATMGTGSSVMGLTDGRMAPHPGMCVTLAWDIGQGPVQALEGNIRAAGATVRWLAKVFGISPETLAETAAAHSAGSVSLVPGFNGLGAPWWDADAVGLITGLTLDTGPGQLMAAAVDSIAHQVADVVEAMAFSVENISQLMIDGGPSTNARLRDTLAAYIDRPVVHCTDPELSALGVAHLAGLHTGHWNLSDLAGLRRQQTVTPVPPEGKVEVKQARHNWDRAISQSRHTHVSHR